MASSDVSIKGVHSRAEVQVSSMDVSPQQGDDGHSTVIRIEGEGPITSNDPRLEGIFKANAVILVNDSGEGVSRDDWQVVDAQTGAVKITGIAHGIHNDPDPIRAVSIGRFEDGAFFFAHARVIVPPPGAEQPLVIEYGGPGLSDPGNRAVAVRGDVPGLLDGS